MLTEYEKKIIASLQGDIPVVKRPYEAIAQKIGISEEKLIEKLKDLCSRGVIRRFGATIRHQQTGFSANAMVAWKVSENLVPEVGQMMASFRHVTHCYRRDPNNQWPYNLYTMIHAADEASCLEAVREISEKTSVTEYNLLFSRLELKKTSMRYFSLDDEN